MQSKTLYLLLALSVMVAVVTSLEDEDDDELFDMMFETYMEKRGRRGKGKGKGKGKVKGKGSQGPCPDRETCWCAFDGEGGYTQLACAPTARGGQVGL